jgi:Flp pilus assembly pilin Flp
MNVHKRRRRTLTEAGITTIEYGVMAAAIISLILVAMGILHDTIISAFESINV